MLLMSLLASGSSAGTPYGRERCSPGVMSSYRADCNTDTSKYACCLRTRMWERAGLRAAMRPAPSRSSSLLGSKLGSSLTIFVCANRRDILLLRIEKTGTCSFRKDAQDCRRMFDRCQFVLVAPVCGVQHQRIVSPLVRAQNAEGIGLATP